MSDSAADPISTGTSTTTRPIAVRRRPDVVAVTQEACGDLCYVLKNPVDLQYHRLLSEEYFVWRSLDGRTSLERLKQEFERRFTPQRIRHEELQRLVMTLHERNLVYSIGGGQGDQLRRRRSENRRKEWFRRLANPLAIRTRGIDPDRVLGRLLRLTRFLFHPAWVVCWCVFAAATLLTCLIRFQDFVTRLPRFQEFFTPGNLFWLALVMAAVKIVHELGHGLACKYFGGQVRELGVMLLMFTPCLYCNVSDSWMFPSKWRRAAVGAAGMYFEAMLATLAVWIWRLGAPGVLNDTALNVAFVCSVGTLIFNINPLLKFDGYYIMSDLLEITNLGEKSGLAVRRVFSRVCLGVDAPPDYRLPENREAAFAAYGVASFCYRWFVTLSILYFLHGFFKQHRLSALFYALVVLGWTPGLAQFLTKVWKMLTDPNPRPKKKLWRCLATGAAAIIVIAGLFAIPISDKVHCPAEIVPQDDHAIYAEVPGVLVDVDRQYGERVERGDGLAQLDNIDMRIEEAGLQARRDECEATLAALEKTQFNDRNAALEVAVARRALDAAERSLEERKGDVRRLAVVSPVGGYVLPPPDWRKAAATDEALPTWHGDLFERRNLGCKLDEGTMICRIGDPRRLEAELVVEHRYLDVVAVGQRVEILFDELPGRRFGGAIVELAQSNLKFSPKRLSNKGGGDLASKADLGGNERPRHASYLARVAFDDVDSDLLRLGVRGNAKIYVGSATVAQIADRYLRDLFNFRL